MKVIVVMYGLAGELDRKTIDMPDGELTVRELGEKLEWIIKPGDILRFVDPSDE